MEWCFWQHENVNLHICRFCIHKVVFVQIICTKLFCCYYVDTYSILIYFHKYLKKNYFRGYILLFYCHDKCVANSVHNLQLGWMNNLMSRVQLKCPTYANQRTLVWAIPAPFEDKLAMWPNSIWLLLSLHIIRVIFEGAWTRRYQVFSIADTLVLLSLAFLIGLHILYDYDVIKWYPALPPHNTRLALYGFSTVTFAIVTIDELILSKPSEINYCNSQTAKSDTRCLVSWMVNFVLNYCFHRLSSQILGAWSHEW